MNQHTFKTWIRATRPWSFTASALTALSFMCYLEWVVGDIHWLKGLWGIGSMILFHAAGNTWSDWHDYRKGVDAADTHGIDTLTSGRFTPASILALSISLYALAIGLGLWLMCYTGMPLLWIGIIGFMGALLYPPLKYRALGDAVIMLNYCLLPALGISYTVLGIFEPSVMWIALPIGLLVDAILHANNTRDMRTDRRAHTRTIAHMLGAGKAVRFYQFETLFPFIWVVGLIPFGVFPYSVLAIILLLPFAWRNCRTMNQFKDETHDAVISKLDLLSARLHLYFCLSLICNILFDLWLH